MSTVLLYCCTDVHMVGGCVVGGWMVLHLYCCCTVLLYCCMRLVRGLLVDDFSDVPCSTAVVLLYVHEG